MSDTETQATPTHVDPPTIVKLLYLIAAATFILGFGVALAIYPEAKYGTVEPVAIIPSVIWFVGAVIQAALFTAIGAAIAYLDRISRFLDPALK